MIRVADVDGRNHRAIAVGQLDPPHAEVELDEEGRLVHRLEHLAQTVGIDSRHCLLFLLVLLLPLLLHRRVATKVKCLLEGKVPMRKGKRSGRRENWRLGARVRAPGAAPCPCYYASA